MTDTNLTMDTVYEQFREIFGGEPQNHPLYQQMKTDHETGKRAIPSLLCDLDEAKRFRSTNAR